MINIFCYKHDLLTTLVNLLGSFLPAPLQVCHPVGLRTLAHTAFSDIFTHSITYSLSDRLTQVSQRLCVALCLNSNEMLCVVLCVNDSLNFICISYYFFTIPQYMNNDFKNLRITDSKLFLNLTRVLNFSKSWKHFDIF